MKPIIKWPGGKRELVPVLHELLPPSYNTYYEPFFGGGAVLFSLENDKPAVINDINPELINLYTQIKNDPATVINCLELMDSIHNSSDDPKKYYYQVRDWFNSDLGDKVPEQAARFIYLNKHCFNGSFRVRRE